CSSLCRDGLSVVGSRCRNPGLPERTALGEEDRFVAGGRKLRHDGLGPFHGGGLGRHRSRLGVARRRLVLWSADQQLLWLVSHCLYLLSAIRVVSQKPSDYAIADRSLAARYLFYAASAAGNLLVVAPLSM